MQQYHGHQHCMVEYWSDLKTVQIPDVCAPAPLAAVWKQGTGCNGSALVYLIYLQVASNRQVLFLLSPDPFLIVSSWLQSQQLYFRGAT